MTLHDIPPQGLAVRALHKAYGQKSVLRGVSLEVEPGEIVALLGPNGAGKTSCFYCITGLVRPDKGAVYLDGAPITRLPMYRRARLGIGYLPQEASIFRGMNVEDNIRAIAQLHTRNRREENQTTQALLEEFGLTHVRRSPALALSGGERRRVEIARALASNPRYILLDEPFAGVDPLAVADVRNLVLHLKERGLGVLITDHNVRDTLDLATRACIVFDGAVLLQGPPETVINNPDVQRVYLGDTYTRVSQ
jgi:lipopolysaccharide export system ATP-binding protein